MLDKDAQELLAVLNNTSDEAQEVFFESILYHVVAASQGGFPKFQEAYMERVREFAEKIKELAVEEKEEVLQLKLKEARNFM